MLPYYRNLLGLYFAAATLAVPAIADSPLLTIQSSSSLRLIQVIQDLGLPDPIEAAGLETTGTLELLQGTVDLRSTSGGFVFFNDERPHLIICMPLLKAEVSINELPTFAGAKFVKDGNNVYQLDSSTKFFAKQAGGYLLFGDSKEHMEDAVSALATKPWSKIEADIKILGDLRDFIPIQRAMLVKEAVSIFCAKPKTELLLNIESLKEHTRYGLQTYLIKSILDCEEFDLTLNQTSTGDISVSMATQEKNLGKEIASNFRFNDSKNATCIVDIATILSAPCVADLVSWTKSKEKEILDAISGESVSDVSDLESTQKIVRLLSETIRQSVSNQTLDAGLTIGNTDGNSHLSGGIMVSNGVKLGTMMQEVIDMSSQFGLISHDLRSDEEKVQTGRINAAIEIPETSSLGLTLPEGSRLHIDLSGNRLYLSLGTSGELAQMMSNVLDTSKRDYPLNIACDLDAGKELGTNTENVLPLGFRRIYLTVSRTEQGRKYETQLSNRVTKSTENPGPIASRAN